MRCLLMIISGVVLLSAMGCRNAQQAPDLAPITQGVDYFGTWAINDTDNQLFNIAVQGRASVNNGYRDRDGYGLRIGHLPEGGRQWGIGERPYDGVDRYPLQMFDRGVRVGDHLFVGITRESAEEPATS